MSNSHRQQLTLFCAAVRLVRGLSQCERKRERGVSSVACFKGSRMQEENFVFRLLFKFLNSTPASPEATMTLDGLFKFEMCLKPVMLTISKIAFVLTFNDHSCFHACISSFIYLNRLMIHKVDSRENSETLFFLHFIAALIIYCTSKHRPTVRLQSSLLAN